MKRQGLPIWLLRDVPALLGVMISFWPLVILVITNGFRAMAGKKVSRSAFEDFPILLAHAEARLAFALWREAYRRVGWNPRGVIFNLTPSSDTWAETTARFHTYMRALRDMNIFVDAYVDDLRARYNISERELLAHGSTDARLRRAAHHELVGVATFSLAASPLALILSSARSARPSKDERGHTHARGPPFAIRYSLLAQPTSARPRLRPHPLARLRNPPGSPPGNSVLTSERSPSAARYAGEPPRR